MNFNDRVYDLVRKIPRGFVMSYGQIAGMLGSRRASRAVGYAMFRCTQRDVPCHRVVYRDGSMAGGYAFGGEGKQRARLEKEGVTFTEDGRVDIRRHRYRPSASVHEN